MYADNEALTAFTHHLPLLQHTHQFNDPLSGTTRVSRYQKGKTNLDFTEARDSEWQWHQPGQMQVCTSLQTDNHASTPPLCFFTGWMPFLPPNQQRQSIEGNQQISPTSLPQQQTCSSGFGAVGPRWDIQMDGQMDRQADGRTSYCFIDPALHTVWANAIKTK